MGLSVWQILLVVLLLVLLFGRGKISELMGDMARGIKSFKQGLSDEEAEAEAEGDRQKKNIEHQTTETVSTETKQEEASSKQ